jgi:hypothetical protein
VPSKKDVWDLCLRVSEQLIEMNQDHLPAIERIGLCYAQIMLRANLHSITPEGVRTTFQAIFEEAETRNGALMQKSND